MKCFLPIVFCFSALPLFAQWDHSLPELKYNLSFSCKILYADSSSTLSEVLKRRDWKVNRHGALRLTESGNCIWIQFDLSSPDNLPMHLQAVCPYIDHFKVYSTTDHGFESLPAVGDKYAFDQRVVKESYPTQIIKNDSTGNRFYVKVYALEDIVFPLMIYNTGAYISSRSGKVFIYGIYMGLMLIILAFNLIMFFSVRHLVYLVYSFYLAMAALTQSALFGDPLTFLYGGSAFLSRNDVVLFGSLLLIFGSEFFQSYFSFRKKSAIWVLLRLTQLLTAIALFAALFTNIGFTFDVLNVLNVWASLLALVVALILSLKGSKMAMIILTGWSVFLLGTILFVLQMNGIIPYSIPGNYAMPAGTALEALILSFAVGYRMKILRETSSKKDDVIFRQMEINKKLAHEIEHSEIQFLQAQMNPHFLFNALNTIQNFIVQKDNRNASYYLGNVSGLLRTSLDILDGQLISLEKEIEFVEGYLKAESMRYGRNLKYRIQHNDDIDPFEVHVPPFLIQPFVENALKHAFGKDTKKPTIEILFSEDQAQKRLLISISDNGKGLGKHQPERVPGSLNTEPDTLLDILPNGESGQKEKSGSQDYPLVEDYYALALERKYRYRKEEKKGSHIQRGISLVKRRLDILNDIYPNFKSSLVITNRINSGVQIHINLPLIYTEDDQYSNY